MSCSAVCKPSWSGSVLAAAYALTATDGARLYAQNRYDLVLFTLETVEGGHLALLEALRRAKTTPILIFTDTVSDEEEARIIDQGADFCLHSAMSPPRIAKFAFSLIRRYTTYNHYDVPETLDAAPFSVEDIFIAPLRRSVHVLDRPVELRPREFSLLLYFMRNPGIVLTKLSGDYEQKQAQLRVSTAELRRTVESSREQETNAKQFLKLAKSYIEPDELTAAMLHALVDKIIAHAPDKSSGHRRQ